jgi:flagellar biosynthesis protein
MFADGDVADIEGQQFTTITSGDDATNENNDTAAIAPVKKVTYKKILFLPGRREFSCGLAERRLTVKEPVKLAVALKYADDGADAPVVIASGRGEIAEKILQAAQKEKVPVYKDQSLAQLLASLEMGTEIPPELYQAVAQVIAFVWQLDKKYSGGNGGTRD